MLGEILTTLKIHQGNEIDTNVGRNVGLTIKEVALLLSISQRQAERLFASLKSKGGGYLVKVAQKMVFGL